MIDDQMTLVERLTNPIWVHSNSPFDGPQLDRGPAIDDMRAAAKEIDRLTELAKLQGQEIRITRERDEALESALQNIAAMDPFGVRADDLGRAAGIARKALGDVGSPLLTHEKGE